MIDKTAPYVIVDVETTGLHADKGDRVIEVAAIILQNGKVLESFSSFIRTGVQIPPAAERIHGISERMLEDKPIPSDVWPKFKEFIGDLPLVAHKAVFDMAFINMEFNKLGITFSNQHICTLELSRRFLKLPNHKLETVARQLLGNIPAGITFHSARGDVLLLAHVWSRMLRNFSF